MLQFYYNPVSVNSRRVWVALLEKQISFEPVVINLDGDQFADEFAKVNPLQRVPVIIDNGLTVVESLAILDYLESRYPSPALMPNEPAAIAQVRMVETITVVELQPETFPLTRSLVGLTVNPDKLEAAQQRINQILQFFEALLGTTPYFIGETLTRADIVAGTLIPSLPLINYPRLRTWAERLTRRESWQQTAYTEADIAAALPNIKAILERRS
ncbi:MAG: glutathione S-transferase family protein [Cyanobacteria bacterium P01_H01_bin.153]